VRFGTWRFFLSTLLVAGCSILSGGTATAAIIDFTSGPYTEGNPVPVETFSSSSITATFSNAIMVKGGDPRFGFNGNGSDIAAAPFDADNWFITDDLAGGTDFGADPGTDISIVFSQAVQKVSFLVADLEQYTSGGKNFTEKLEVFVNGSSSASVTLNGLAQDAAVATVTLPDSSITSLRIDAFAETSSGEKGRFAFGIDNIQATPVPTPSALASWALLSFTGLFGVCFRRRRRS
jgi:hypothetical protein